MATNPVVTKLRALNRRHKADLAEQARLELLAQEQRQLEQEQLLREQQAEEEKRQAEKAEGIAADFVGVIDDIMDTLLPTDANKKLDLLRFDQDRVMRVTSAIVQLTHGVVLVDEASLPAQSADPQELQNLQSRVNTLTQLLAAEQGNAAAAADAQRKAEETLTHVQDELATEKATTADLNRQLRISNSNLRAAQDDVEQLKTQVENLNKELDELAATPPSGRAGLFKTFKAGRDGLNQSIPTNP